MTLVAKKITHHDREAKALANHSPSLYPTPSVYVSTSEDASPDGPRIFSAFFVGAVGEEHREALLADLGRWAEGGPFRLLLFAEETLVVDESLTSGESRLGAALRRPPLAGALDRIALAGDDAPSPPADRPAGGPTVRRFGDDWQGALQWLRADTPPTS